MDKEILNSDGSRNYQANILLDNVKRLEKENERLKARLRPLEDSYFKGLSSIEIAELAKKSIRITAENRKLEYALQETREYCEEQNLKADYTACEIIDKINSVIGVE